MIYGLQVRIVTDSQVLIDGIKDVVKPKAHTKLWQDDLAWLKETLIDSNGHLVLIAEVKYLSQVDRDVTLDWLKAQASSYKSLLIGPEGFEEGSLVIATDCIHKKVFEGTNVQGEHCVETYRWAAE